MGVKGLQFYIENHCSSVCQTVSIPTLVKNFKAYHPGIEPILVIDGCSLLGKLYKGLEWIYGGQWIQYIEVLKEFVSQFRRIGVKLVIFFDGCVVKEKRSEWIKRRQKRLLERQTAMNFIKVTHREPHDEKPEIPTNLPTLTRFIFKYYLQLDVYSSTQEVDAEVAAYAKNNEAVFAIMAQDTDFMIFDTKPYISTKHLDLSNMTTILYDRLALASHLSLTISQLPLLASMVSNDIIPIEMLRTFHYKLCRTSNVVYSIPAISQLIRKNAWKNNDDLKKLIAREALGSEHNLKLLDDSLMSYSVSETLPNLIVEDTVTKKQIMVENVPPVYNIVHNMTFDSSEVIEDANSPVSLAYKDIRRRCYYIAFSGKIDSAVTEWLAYTHNDLFRNFRPDIVYPLNIEVPGGVPSMMDLWNEKMDLKDVRRLCFYKCLDINLDESHLNTIPKSYCILSCLLNYLLTRSPSLINIWEAVAFVVQAVRLKRTSARELHDLRVTHVDARAIHLGSLFVYGTSTMAIALGICGLPLHDWFPWNYFDGKLFHHIFCQVVKIQKVKDLCQDQEEETLARQIISVVTSNTEFQNMAI